MGSTDRPSAPNRKAGDPEALELVRVGGRDGWRPALLAIVAVTIVLGAAIWKPWVDDLPADSRPSGLPGATAGGRLPAPTSQPVATDAPELTPDPSRVTFAALDLALMGTADPHDDWGVAVAYVTQRQFDLARARGASTVTPVVSWELVEPGRSEPGSTLDHPDATSVAIAATWPRGMIPRTIRLFFTVTRPSGDPATEEILLGWPLWSLLRDVPFDGTELTARSGDFFLPPFGRPSQPADWLGNGWPAGTYVLDVEFGPDVRVSLPFTLGGTRSP